MNLLSVFRMALADRRHGATDVERQLIRSLLEYRTAWGQELLLQGALLIQTRSPMANLRRLAENLKEAPDLEGSGSGEGQRTGTDSDVPTEILARRGSVIKCAPCVILCCSPLS